MTQLMIRALAAGSGRARLRAVALALFAIAMSAAATAWFHAIDRVQGVTRDGQALTTGDAVRDALFALPALAGAVWLGLAVTRRLIAAARAEEQTVCSAAVLTGAVSAIGAVGAATASSLAGTMSAASGGSFDRGFAALLSGRILIALPVTVLAATLVTVALYRAKPWSVPVPGAPRRVPPVRIAMGVSIIGAALLALAGVVGESLSPPARAAAGPGQPCPTGTPMRDYRVQAIDVDITINRFGDHDPLGKMFVLTGYGSTPRTAGDGQFATFAETNQLTKVRQQEASGHVSLGLRDDPIQPLVIRANVGECVEIAFTNDATGGDVGMHIDGLSYDVGSSGDAVGANASSTATRGVAEPTIYRYYVPDDPGMEGGRYIRPGPGNRQLVNHGLFGVLAVQPKGSVYRSSYTGALLPSGWGWEAIIDPPGAAKSFREHVPILHEIGNEKEQTLLTAAGVTIPQVGLLSSSYRPGTRAINYRSEPFENRLVREARAKSLGYNAYTFGDPPTPMPRSYLGDPTKVRLIHGGTEMLHVYHLHGGGIRWRMNPKADPTFDYQDTGLNKHPVANSGSQRLDSQSQAPGDSYNLEIEGGAGGVQQSAGDFLFHCHIAHHYVSGMWSYWRVHDTNQPDLAALPDRAPLPNPVTSAGLIGKTMPNGTTIDATNLAQWVEPQLPSPGVPLDWDGSVWDWTRSGSVYLGAPEDTVPFPNLTNANDVSRPWDPAGQVRALANHPGSFVGDQFDGGRPRILFNPLNGRPTHPLTRPQIGQRAPFSPGGHSGAPWLGARGLAAPAAPADPYSGRQDGLCPTGAEAKQFNLVSLDLPIEVSPGQVDGKGKLFVLAKNKEGVLNGTKPREPLAIRLNRGQCGFVSLVSEQPDDPLDGQPFSMTNAHIHHVQFDVQASDGVGTGMQFGQAVRPYRLEDTTLAATAAAGTSTLNLAAPPATSINGLAKFRVGVWIGIGLGTENIEVRKIVSVNGAGDALVLNRPLETTHPAGQWAGTEFVQYVWYPDVALDNIFWHDHVDGIHNWGHGLVSQLIIEPPGSTYHDPTTGAEVDSGNIVDIRTSSPLIPGVVEGSFREFAALAIDENPANESTYNLRSAPFDARLLGPSGNPDPSLVLSSYTHGDPGTPLPRAYVGDPVVIRHMSTSPAGDTFVVDGHTFRSDARLAGSSSTDAVVHGISDRFTLALNGGAGGPLKQAGDYLYRNGVGRRFRQGAWGIMRVLDRQSADLQPLPGRPAPPGPFTLPAPTGGRPPTTGGNPGDPCPTTAPIHPFAVSAVELPVGVPVPGAPPAITKTFVLTKDAGNVAGGLVQPDPLVLHVAEGECVEVTLKNELAAERASFHVGELVESPRSSGVNVGFNPEQTAAPGETVVYRYYARDARIGAAAVSDFGGLDTGPAGMYAAIVVAPRGASFRDPATGAYQDVGTQVDVSAPGVVPYRDMAAVLMADDPEIGQNDMPYPEFVGGAAFFNHSARPVVDGPAAFSSAAAGDPSTAVYTAEAGDRTIMHAIGAPGMESISSFSAGGQAWHRDPAVPGSEVLTTGQVGSGIAIDMDLIGGAGGPAGAVGDHFVGDLRRPFTVAGMWGLMRVSPPGASGTLPLSAPFPAVPWRPRSASDPGAVTLQGDVTFPKLFGLKLPKRVSLQSLQKNGLKIRVRGTTDYGKITVKLEQAKASLASAEIKQGKPKTLKKKPLRAPSSMVVSRAGVASITWRVPARALAKMRPGKFRVKLVWRGQTLSGTITVFDATCKQVKTRKQVTKKGVTRTVVVTETVCLKKPTTRARAKG